MTSRSLPWRRARFAWHNTTFHVDQRSMGELFALVLLVHLRRLPEP